jgi:glycosyltransferase involved in cell wall biosynthesis
MKKSNKFAVFCKQFTNNISIKITQNPKSLLGSRILVIKSPNHNEHGVIVVDYLYVFPLLIKLFDIQKIASKYYIVLEPSWSGYCTSEILLYYQFKFPVFIESAEKKDTSFIESMGHNLIPVPIAANWWIDHRLMPMDHHQSRDIDIIMIAAWAKYKRHYAFFRHIYELKKSHPFIKVVLVGYPLDRTKDDITTDAKITGIIDNIEIYENISSEYVAHLLCRSKAHVLWSRREGFNRAIIEAMFADVPVILREGFNYGDPYPYINTLTGCYANEYTLSGILDNIISGRTQYHPRKWVENHMTCHNATTILGNKIREYAINCGENWKTDLTVKIGGLGAQCYWTPSDYIRFNADYAFLESSIRC